MQESSTKLLNFYVADLLCLAQIENGTFRKSISKFNLREAIAEVITIQKQKAEALGIYIYMHFIGFRDGNVDVITDKMRLQQVLLSYQSNALKFTPVGGSITIISEMVYDMHCNKHTIEVKVRDTGCGIS